MESGTKDQGVVFSSNATNCAGAHELTGGECIYRQDARAYTPARYVGLENVLVRDTTGCLVAVLLLNWIRLSVQERRSNGSVVIICAFRPRPSSSL